VRSRGRTLIRISKSREKRSPTTESGGFLDSCSPQAHCCCCCRGFDPDNPTNYLVADATRGLLGQQDEPHPTLTRTVAAPLKRTGWLCQGQCPGRSRYSFVPGFVAIQKRRALLRTGGDQFGSAHDRAGRLAFPPSWWRKRPASQHSVRLPGLRPRTPAADSRSIDIGVSSCWLAPQAPVRPRLTGRPVAQCRTKRCPSKTSLVCSMW
jgi:hypothetical protein